jgi:hypothetical protein
MASNDYYHSNIPSPPAYEQAVPGTTAPGRTTPAAGATASTAAAPGLGYSSYTTSHHDDPSVPYHNRESQHSIASDGGAYYSAGGAHDGDHYSENIPLKSQTQFGNNPEWQNQQTQYNPYPPSPGAVENLNRGRGDPRQQQQKRGFFKKKPAWATWILTLAMIITFIIELVKTGELCLFNQETWGLKFD